jgi:hypothetical protein
MSATNEIFNLQEEEIIADLSVVSNYFTAQKYILLEFMRESEIDLYLSYCYVKKGFFYMQKGLHFVLKGEIYH